MKLNTIFSKPVDRPIEGVIKADDEASIRIEIDEYVLTNEVEKRLESFLEAYNKYQGANGVWISGFFGSGKSHLLKLLAILLENREVDGVKALKLFLPKCGKNEILRADLTRAVSLPSKSILFNIDQKADVISKTQIDALLSVFVKVFDEMCGYYGKQGHIAQFECDLDKNNKYDSFKEAYNAVAGRPWHIGREQALLEARNIAKAYAKVSGGDEITSVGILDKYRTQYKVSIEDFAEKINAYIKRQPTNFRLNFFVDEVGQYIADNVKLMTNLQTIAESLATKCSGRAWVIVTAQEEMATVVGELSKQQSNDFSKIQARFANRMKLTSADVAEVIQKRLLSKTSDGSLALSKIYQTQFNNFKTLFDFADGSQTYQNFQDDSHFINCYPFIPYQFALFQLAIKNLSDHNGFEGKHSSVGERSMLGVFQQVAIHIGEHQIGQLATFDLMFEGIRTSLKSNIQRSIFLAETHLSDPLAVRLLKALFLVKYVKEFKSTIRNIGVLMLDDFAEDLPAQKKRIEQSLALLEQQTYIQRNGECFEYLTDEEKDVEQEIKNTAVDSSDVNAELEKIIFENVIKERKFKPFINGPDYSFTKKLDNRICGREYELIVHVLSPFSEIEPEEILKIDNLQNELVIIMPQDDRFIFELLMFKRTDKYIRQNITMTQRDTIKRILSDKSSQNSIRYSDIQKRALQLMGKAKFYHVGRAIDINTEDHQRRIAEGFQTMVNRLYTNFEMLRGYQYTEEFISTILNDNNSSISNLDAEIGEAGTEILSSIQSDSKNSMRVTLKALIDKFESKPYGWPQAAILCLVTKLFVHNKIAVRLDSHLVTRGELKNALIKTHGQVNVILEPQIEFTASQVRSLKDFISEFFGNLPAAQEAKALGEEASREFNKLIQDLTQLNSQISQYPFAGCLIPILATLKLCENKIYTWYLTDLPQKAEQLYQMKEEIIDPLKTFMKGPQKTIYDGAKLLFRDQGSNFSYINNDESSKVALVLNEQSCFKGNRIQQIKIQVDTLRNSVNEQIELEIKNAKSKIANLKNRIEKMPAYNALKKDQQDTIKQKFDEYDNKIDNEKLIDVIRNIPLQFETKEMPNLINQIMNWANPPINGKQDAKFEFVHCRDIKVPFEKPFLSDEADVEHYSKTLNEALKAEIRKGKKIQI